MVEKNVDEMTLEEKASFYEEEAAKWKAFSRKHETAARELFAKSEEAKSEKEEATTLREELDALKNELASKKHAEAVNLIIAETGLPATAAKFISGSSEEELKKSAEELKNAFVTEPAKPAPNSIQGKERKATSASSLGIFLNSQLNN